MADRRVLRRGSLGAVFDHVGIAVSDLAASERFYRTVMSALGVEPSHADAELVEWEDWAIGPIDAEHPLTRGLHVGFRAPSPAAVEAFRQAGVDAGYRDDGDPPLPSAASCSTRTATASRPSTPRPRAGRVDRPALDPRRRPGGLPALLRDDRAVRRDRARRRRAGPRPLQTPGFSFSLIDDARPRTENVHIAFPAGDDATVRAFHAAALAAGYADHGAPGERAVYHPGYYGAFVLDPDGHNVEVVNHNR